MGQRGSALLSYIGIVHSTADIRRNQFLQSIFHHLLITWAVLCSSKQLILTRRLPLCLWRSVVASAGLQIAGRRFRLAPTGLCR